MRSYRLLFRTREFTPLFLSSSLQVAASTIGGLALGTSVYETTGSPLLSALSMFGPSLAQVIGATTLLSAADRLPPRATTTGLALIFTASTATLTLPGLPLWAVFTVIAVQGLIASLGGGVRWGLLNEILREGSQRNDGRDGYLLGRSVFNMMHGVMQITGYATGGTLVALLSPHITLLVSAALYATAALCSAVGLTRRPPRASGRPSVAETWRTNVRLWSYAPRRRLYLGLWVPNGLVVGCESLFVAYDPDHAGLLFACAALGMLTGDITVGRLLPPRVRDRLATPLLLLLATPYLLLAPHPPTPVAAACATLASIGFGASLVQQQRLLALTPPELTGHALGLHSAGMLTLQGLSAGAAGAVAQWTSPGVGITVMAAASAAVTLGLWAAGRDERRAGLTSPARTRTY
ncbi:MFS transporter [Streptomyces ipomoeae]|uniref:MFS transporter n=1 Tax=Streptomyces ipomoeae TaxID=103232 RepID=UPI0011464E77|nr:MFS transporter [Streptomyces ipomoeae]MDX2939068.1 MFS transporter [Streptomyces ipomoeae]TQE20568.1 MFS transporter [Streptomyces ipomoeae]